MSTNSSSNPFENEELKRALQRLKDIQEMVDKTIPVVLKDTLSSPAFQAAFGLAEQTKNVVPDYIKQIAEQIERVAPYEQTFQNFLSNITPSLIKIAKVSAPLGAIHKLGKAEYVVWNRIDGDLVERLASIQDNKSVIHCVDLWLREKEYEPVDDTIDKLKECEGISGDFLFIQSIEAYNTGAYNLAATGLTAINDRLLSEYTGMITNVSISKRVEKLKEKINKGGETTLDDLDFKEFALISSYTNALESFGASSSFEDQEPDLNRHWIMHGRMSRRMERIDCIRIINILYGTILMNELGIKLSTEEVGGTALSKHNDAVEAEKFLEGGKDFLPDD